MPSVQLSPTGEIIMTTYLLRTRSSRISKSRGIISPAFSLYKPLLKYQADDSPANTPDGTIICDDDATDKQIGRHSRYWRRVQSAFITNDDMSRISTLHDARNKWVGGKPRMHHHLMPVMPSSDFCRRNQFDCKTRMLPMHSRTIREINP
jgi:hypothetical protein